MRSPLHIALSVALLVSMCAGSTHAQNAGDLERNKKVVLDFYRHVFEAQNPAAAADFLTEDYIQHNPRVATGRAAFVEFFSKIWKTPKPVEATLRDPPAILMAEGDLVTLVFKRMKPEPADATKQYESFWFDTFSVNAAGKIVEHWDGGLK